MATIRQEKKIVDDVYIVSIQVIKPSVADLDLIERFGMPSLDLGGEFSEGELAFTLPTLLVPLIGEAPAVAEFDVRDEADSEDRALLWLSTVNDRITAALDSLRENTDSFTGQSEATY